MLSSIHDAHDAKMDGSVKTERITHYALIDLLSELAGGRALALMNCCFGQPTSSHVEDMPVITQRAPLTSKQITVL